MGPAEVSKPGCNRTPEICDASEVAQLVKDKNIARSRTNAECLAQAAIACYVQHASNLKDQLVPKSEAAVDVQMAAGGFTKGIEEKFFDTASDWVGIRSVETVSALALIQHNPTCF
ncbi:MAG: hypothetical protein MMC23_006776 [Stictis urceolatum]|nr:hypothetical protein [Stictis urceolata]